MVLVDHLHKMADYQRYCLNAFKFFLGPNLLPLEFLLIVLDEVLLNPQEFQMSLELVQLLVLIVDL